MNDVAPTRLEARFEAGAGKTRLAHCHATAPLKIAKVFTNDDAAGVCVMDASPGLLAGDDYALAWRLECGARVDVTTQGFTRAHPASHHPSRLRQHISVAEGAWLDYHPEPLLLYRDAVLRNEIDIEVAAGGAVLFTEIVGAGRIARDEAFLFQSYESRLRARYGGRLAYVSHTALRPAEFDPRRVGAWEDYTHQGYCLVIAERSGAALRDALHEALTVGDAEVRSGLSLLAHHGVIVALLGRRAWDLQQATHRVRAAANAYLRGC